MIIIPKIVCKTFKLSLRKIKANRAMNTGIDNSAILVISIPEILIFIKARFIPIINP